MSSTYIDLKTLQLQLQYFQSLSFQEKLNNQEVSSKYFNVIYYAYRLVTNSSINFV